MRARIVIALIACALAAVSCGKKTDPQATPSFATDASPTASAEPGTTATAGQPTPAKTTAGAPTYPGNAKDYTKALLTALGNKDKTRIDQLAQQAAVMQLATYYNLNGHWNTYVSCQPDGGSHTLCVYRNNHGDVASVKLVNSQLGYPTAVVEALIDKTTYATDPSQYASTFVGAWQDGNLERMRQLSNNNVVSFFKGKSAPSGYSTSPMAAGDYYDVTIYAVPYGDGYKVRIAKASLGKAGAIVSAAAS